MTQVTTDPTTGTTAVLLSPSESTGTTTSASGRGQGAGTGESPQTGFDARDRIHRIAGAAHQAIDKVQQTLSSKAQGVSSTQSKYGEQARQYGETAREQINSRPLQAAAIAFGTGVIVDKLFMGKSKEKVRVVRVPVQTRSYWDAGPSAGQTARRWTDSARARGHDLSDAGREAMGKAGAAAGYGLGRASSIWDSAPSLDRTARRWTDAVRERGQDLADAGQGAIGKVGAAAGAGLAGTKMMASTLTSNLSTLPLQMRLATQRLLARSQEYGSMTRAGVQAHPMIGLGALAGAGALLTTLWLQRRGADDDSYVGLNERSDSLYRQRYTYSDTSSGIGGTIASRPVTSAVVMLGIGALLGALLKRR